jgi:hypothetical protein
VIPGVKMQLGSQEWIVPPLNIRQLDDEGLCDKAQGIIKEGAKPDFEAAALVVHAALNRNYPDATLGQVKEMLDLGNWLGAVRAVLGRSGLVASGEEPAAQSQTGADSTAS